MIKKVIALLLVPSFVLALGAGTTKKIDTIESNTQTDILLSPSGVVDLSYFTGQFALESDINGGLVESAVTSTELGYVSGVTSSIQTQINGKEDSLPLSVNGDLLFYNTGMTSLGIGSEGQLLTVQSGLPGWADAPVSTTLDTKGQLQGFSTVNANVGPCTDDQILVYDALEATGWKCADNSGGTLQETYDDSVGTDPMIQLSSAASSTFSLRDASGGSGSALLSVSDFSGASNYFSVYANNIDLINTNITGRLAVQSTTEASIPCPVMSEASRDLLTPVVGDCVFNSTSNKPNNYNGSAWEQAEAVNVTTKGDIQTYSTTADRLPVGSDGDHLIADSSTSTGLDWKTRLVVKANALIGATSSVSFAFNYVNTITEIVDNFNALADTGDIVFTVPTGKDGYYDIDLGIRVDYSSDPSGASFECGLAITSSSENSRAFINPTYTGIGYGKCLFLNLKLDVGDTVKFYARKGGTASVTWNTDTRFSYLEISERL